MLFRSQKENALRATFQKDGNHEVVVEFVSIDDSMKYKLSLNYDPKIDDIFILKENSKWEKTFDSTKYNDVESDLNLILK